MKKFLKFENVFVDFQLYIDRWKADMNVYKADMLAWRKKMADEGHQDVVETFKDKRYRAVSPDKTKRQVVTLLNT